MPDVRLYYIIEGMLEVQIEKKCYRMKKDDILVINVGVRAGKIETYESDALICELCFENRILAELLENENGRFVCNSVEHPGQSYERLKKIIQQILRQRGLNLHKTKSYEYSLIYQLLDELIEHYWIVNSELQVSREVTDRDWKRSCDMYTVIIRRISVWLKWRRNCTFQLLHYPDFLKSKQGCILRNMWGKYVCIMRKMN